MAIYQAPRKRWRLTLVAGIVGVLIGLIAGLVGGGGDSDPLAALRELDMKLEEAASPLDVLVIHGEADTGSAGDPRVVIDAVARTSQRFDEVRDSVVRINREAVVAFDGHVARLRKLAREDGDADAIADEAEELADLLRGIVLS